MHLGNPDMSKTLYILLIFYDHETLYIDFRVLTLTETWMKFTAKMNGEIGGFEVLPNIFASTQFPSYFWNNRPKNLIGSIFSNNFILLHLPL